jgi:thiamine biosynthesis lipoprotein
LEESTNKKRDIVILAVLLIAVVAILIISLRPTDEVRRKTYYGYFDTICTVSDYSGDDEEAFPEICAFISDELGYYHRLFNIYETYEGVTNIAYINSMAGQGPVSVGEELFTFLEYCVEIERLTGGEVNIAMGSVLSLWHDLREEGVRIPTPDELAAAAEHVSITSLVLDRNAMTVEITDPDASLDVGAIAKGYATERIAEALTARGISGYALDFGGNLRVVGTKPGGVGWSAGVQNPDPYATDRYVCELTVSDTSLVTSGDYERYYTVDGKRYHHIIDKDTLMPAEHFASVSILCRDSGLADALSTALFTMSYEDGVALLSSLDGVGAVWVTQNGEVLKYNID